jgi:LysM repeat protein
MTDWERPGQDEPNDAPPTERLSAEPVGAAGVTVPRRRGGLSPALVLGGVVLALTLLAIWYFLLSGRGDNGPAQVATSPSAAASTTQAAVPETATAGTEGGQTYIVAEGDTLGAIALRFDTTVDALVQANGITDPNRVTVGQELVIPGAGAASPSPSPSPSASG